jgi:hypothetical protein
LLKNVAALLAPQSHHKNHRYRKHVLPKKHAGKPLLAVFYAVQYI